MDIYYPRILNLELHNADKNFSDAIKMVYFLHNHMNGKTIFFIVNFKLCWQMSISTFYQLSY